MLRRLLLLVEAVTVAAIIILGAAEDTFLGGGLVFLDIPLVVKASAHAGVVVAAIANAGNGIVTRVYGGSASATGEGGQEEDGVELHFD